MPASGQLTPPAVQALLEEASLAGSWVLDAAKSRVELKTRHTWGLLPLSGVFHEVSGAGTVSPTGQVSGTISVAAASIDTKHKKRDRDLRSERLFDAGKYPNIIFTIDRITPGTGSVTAEGSLAVRDRSRPYTFPVQVSVAGEDEVVLDAEVQVNRTDFGLTFNPLGMASMDNTIIIHAVFTRR